MFGYADGRSNYANSFLSGAGYFARWSKIASTHNMCQNIYLPFVSFVASNRFFFLKFSCESIQV
jgi:hypothetical protein